MNRAIVRAHLRAIVTAIIGAALGCASLGAATAQDAPDGEITAVYRPTAADTGQSTTGKFVLFGWDEGMASVWAFVPGGNDPVIIKRCDLVKSPWAPDLLFMRRVPSAFVRLQIPMANGRGYRVNVYAFDYRTWDVRLLARSRQITGLGYEAPSLFLQTDGGVRIVDTNTGATTEPDRDFARIADFGDVWLVRFEGDGQRTAHLFRPADRKTLRAVTLPAFWSRGVPFGLPSRGLILSPDRRYLACTKPVPRLTLDYGDPPTATRTTIHLLDLESRKTRELPLSVYVTPGSGLPFLYSCLDPRFAPDGDFSYFSAARDGSVLTRDPGSGKFVGEFRKVIVQVRTGTVLEYGVPMEAVDRHFDAKKKERYIPPFLLDSSRAAIERPLDLLAVFFERHGVKQTFRTKVAKRFNYFHFPYRFTPDGKRFFGCAPVSEGRAGFYGDLEKDVLTRVPIPSGMRLSSVEWTE